MQSPSSQSGLRSRPLERSKHPGIFRRGGRYVVVYRDPAGRQRKRAARTLAEARALKASLTADIHRGEFRETSRVSFAEYASEWIATYQGRTSRGFGEGSREDYRRALGLDDEGKLTGAGAVAFFGRMRLATIEPRDVREYARRLATRGLAASSIRKNIAPLRALFATALEDGAIRSNPVLGIRIARTADDSDAQEAKALTEDELRRVLEKLPDSWRPFFEFLAQTGLRIGEAIELRWGDVDGPWLRVTRRYYRGAVGLPKGRRTRDVPLSRELAQALWTLRKESHATSDDFVFTSARGLRIDPHNLAARVLKPACRAAGVGDWLGFHTFRHTCATMLFRRGWNAVQVQKFLGHSDPGFTLRTYVHLLPEDLPEPCYLDRPADRSKNVGADEYGSERKRAAGG
jgi:integrase